MELRNSTANELFRGWRSLTTMELKSSPRSISVPTRRRTACALLALGIVVSALNATGCSRAAAAEPLEAAGPVSLTVYKNDFGMVHERRTVSLRPGANQVNIGGVSNMLDPNSVLFESPKGARVVSTTYELGSGSNAGLMQRLAGKEVEFIWTSSNGEEGDKITGRLEPTSDGGFLLRVGDRVYINPKGTLVGPASVSSLPGLAARVESDGAGDQVLGISYLTRGLSWTADYVAHLDSDAETLSLECWASIENLTGMPFADASVTFVAGNPNRAVSQDRHRIKAEADATLPMNAVADPDMRAEAAGEGYQYKAKDRANIGVDQISRVRMFEAASVPVKLDYSVRLPYLGGWGEQSGRRQNAQLAISLLNSKKHGLGQPMPAGAVRIYQSDGTANRYTGAGSLADLAVNSRTSLTLSDVFDVTAEAAILKSQRVSKNVVRKSLRVVVRNAKPKAVEVRLVQEIYGTHSWAEGDKPQKLNASTLQWKVMVPANGQKTMEAKLNVQG